MHRPRGRRNIDDKLARCRNSDDEIDRQGAPVSNPFEDADARYRVLINDEAQYSLWPVAIPCPDGWTVAKDEDSRATCLEYVEEHWTDMRPASLVRAERD